MKKIGLGLIILQFYWLVPMNSQAQNQILLKSSENINPIGKQVFFFRDSVNLGIENILKPEIQEKFAPYLQDTPNFGSTPDSFWLRFRISKVDDEDFYLQIGSAFIDSIELYAVSEGKIREVQLTGDDLPFSSREIKVSNFLLPLRIEKGQNQIYFLKVSTLQPFFFPLRVGTLKAFMEDNHLLDLIQGIYFGFMILIILYNLFLYFSTKELIYLLYVAYVFSITWFMSTIYQYVFEFVWPNYPNLNKYAVISTAMTILTATFFTRTFLDTKKRAPVLHKISRTFIFLGVVIMLLLLTPYKIPSLILAQGTVFLMAVFFLITGIITLKNGYLPAKYYLLAWGFLIFGFIGAILETVNILPVVYYFNYMQLGSAIEVTLLSLALADRINLYKKEREIAQAEALKASEEKASFIQQQNLILEDKVKDRTFELSKSLAVIEEEKKKSDMLLLNILPFATAVELKETGKATPKYYESVSVLFTDFAGFSRIAETLDASELVGILDDIFRGFDEIVKLHGLEKIKTIGDSYMAAGGISGNDFHPINSVKAALEMQEFLNNKFKVIMGEKWLMRCGIHTGPVTAGVVGKDKFAYDIWGNTVNLASRMESNSVPGKVNVSEATYQLVKDVFYCIPRGEIEAKNLGKVNMYFVDKASSN
jgi:class 3 adenylate cyclase